MNTYHQEKLDLWRARIIECRKSGLSDHRWCKENNIPSSSLYYWIEKLRLQASDIPVSNVKAAPPIKQDVVPLHVVKNECLSPNNASTAIKIQFNSFTLEIVNGASETTITNTFSALRLLC